MNIAHDRKIKLYYRTTSYQYDVDLILELSGYRFIIDEEDIDYPHIDNMTMKAIYKDLNILYKLRIS